MTTSNTFNVFENSDTTRIMISIPHMGEADVTSVDIEDLSPADEAGDYIDYYFSFEDLENIFEDEIPETYKEGIERHGKIIVIRDPDDLSGDGEVYAIDDPALPDAFLDISIDRLSHDLQYFNLLTVNEAIELLENKGKTDYSNRIFDGLNNLDELIKKDFADEYLDYLKSSNTVKYIQYFTDCALDSDDVDTVNEDDFIDCALNSNINAIDEDGKTTLMLAAKYGYSKLADSLIESGANVNAIDVNERTPARWATENGQTDVLKLLIDAGADIHANDKHQNTLAHWAAFYGETDALRILIDAGADVNAKAEDEQTPAHVAAFYGKTDALNILIAHGADINSKDEDEMTPAHKAVHSRIGETDALNILIDAGADINSKDKDGRTLLRLAAEYGHADCVSLIERHELQQARLKPLFDKYDNADQKKAALLGNDKENDQGIGL